MTADVLERLLRGELPDPDGGPTLSVPVRSVAIGDSLAGHEADLVAGLELGARLALVCDDNTHEVLGGRVARALSSLAEVHEVRLSGRPHADVAAVEAVRKASAGCDALIAVGAGTINDLCKYAAAEDGKQYAVFATAPSMNGYTSVNAAITVDGHKKSLPATSAAGVFMDLDVLSRAPARMIRSGLGDSVCRPTAQADWLLAHLLLDLPYREAPFSLLGADEAALLADPEGLVGGSLDAMRGLARTLTLSGFGMTIYGTSHPASEGEHLISHYVEMCGLADLPATFHGEQIGVTTLTMARLQERMLAGGPPRVSATRVTRAEVIAHFGAETGESCWRDFAAKRLDTTAADALNTRIQARWSEISERIRPVTLPSAAIEDVLRRAGAPTTPEALGWPRGFYRNAVVRAREIRDRYTFLDLAGDAGLLEEPNFI